MMLGVPHEVIILASSPQSGREAVTGGWIRLQEGVTLECWKFVVRCCCK